MLIAETKIYRYLQQGHHNNMSAFIASLRVVPIPPPSPHLLLSLPSLQTTAICLPVRKPATPGRLRSSTCPNLDAHDTGTTRSRSRDSRRGEEPKAGSSDETEDGAPYVHPEPPTKRVDSPVRAERKTDQPAPDSGASRRQLSLDPGERHQLPAPRSTGHHRRHLGSPQSTERHHESSRDRGTHTAPLDLA